MDPVAVNCTIIDWCEVTAILFDTFMGACFTVILGGIIALGINWYRRRQFRLQEKILLDLAELREEGVRLRNKANNTTLEGDDFGAWNKEINDWKKRLFKKTSEFSPVEGERLKTLDFMPADVFPVFNPGQVHVLRYVSETLRRLDRLLEQRFRPTQSP